MKKLALLVLAASVLPPTAFANDQLALDACIASWGTKAPFRKGKAADHVIGTGVKVFGIGSGQSGNDAPSEKPVLVYVRPAVNVAGKSTIRLNNPNGWYCFRSNVTVAGTLHIDAQCNAHIASAKDDGTSVGAVDESNKGVAVFGSLRVVRFGCDAGKKK